MDANNFIITNNFRIIYLKWIYINNNNTYHCTSTITSTTNRYKSH